MGERHEGSGAGGARRFRRRADERDLRRAAAGRDDLDVGGLAFHDVEVVTTRGAPEVRLSGHAEDAAGASGAWPVVSLTHSRDTAGAMALPR